jgi:hypothetical protein
MYRRIACVAAALALAGCQDRAGGEDPKRQLNEYISHSFAIKSPEDRGKLLGYLGGEARTRLTAWSDEQFRSAFIEHKKEFIKLAFREVKPVSDSRVSITYELTYLDQTKGKDAKVTQKKMAEMSKDAGRWLITDVRSIKELIEYREELSLP